MPKGVYPHTHLKPKIYPAEMVETVREMYGSGATQAEIGAALGVSQRVIYRLMINHQIPRRIAAKREQSGADNHMWRGNVAGYKALHHRVESVRGKPQECHMCGTFVVGRYEWANLTGAYDDVTDYERMCVSCHRSFDDERRATTGELTSTWGGDAR
jgi:hypothetical protein